MLSTLTYAVRVDVSPDQSRVLSDTCAAYLDCCNMVSWAFYQLRQMIEYKAAQAGHSVIAVDPRYTSQPCPTCGIVCKANRRRETHEYCCSNCGYRSNDDRVAAMNIQRLGYQSLVEAQSDKL